MSRSIFALLRGFVAGLALLIVGCHTNQASYLYADFEEDAFGHQPDFSLPGNTEGDRIDYNGHTEASNPEIGLRMLQIGELYRNKVLRYRSLNRSPGRGNRLSFVGRRPDETLEVRAARWEGFFEFDPIEGANGWGDLNIDLFGLAVLTLRAVVVAGESTTEVYLDSEKLGEMNYAESSVRIEYDGFGELYVDFQPGPTATLRVPPASGNGTISFEFDVPTNVDATYSIDAITIYGHHQR